MEAAATTIENILVEIRAARDIGDLKAATAKAIEALTTEKQLDIRVKDLESKVTALEAAP